MLSENYINRFGGIGRLYGKESLTRFSQSHAMIVGLGGVGSWTVESLARSGIGMLSLVDLDELCVTNTNRQLPAHTGNYGKMKADALAERIQQINPECRVTVHHSFYSEKTAHSLLSTKPDIVVDSIDAVKAKCHLLAECKTLEIPIFSCGGAGGKLDATKVQVDDLSRTHGDKLIGSVRRILRSEYGFPTGEGKKARKFKIPTVFSSETMTAPQPCSLNDSIIDDSAETPRNLNCATGYGAVTHVTATFGLILTQLVLEELRVTRCAT